MRFTDTLDDYSILNADVLSDIAKGAGLFILGSYVLGTELNAQSKDTIKTEHNRITARKGTSFIPGRSIALPNKITVIPGREVKELNYGRTHPRPHEGEWQFMTPQALIDYEKRNIRSMRKKNPLDSLIIADERTVAQWRSELPNNSEMARFPRDKLLSDSIIFHIDSKNKYDGNETAQDALAVGKSGFKGLQFGVIRRTPAYTITTKDKNGKVTTTHYPGEEVKVMMYIPAVKDISGLVQSGLPDSSMTPEKPKYTSGAGEATSSTPKNPTSNTPKKVPSTSDPSNNKTKNPKTHQPIRTGHGTLFEFLFGEDTTSHSKVYGGLVFGRDGSSDYLTDVKGFTIGYSPNSEVDLEGTIGFRNLFGKIEKSDTVWNATYPSGQKLGSTTLHVVKELGGYMAKGMAWVGGRLKAGAGVAYHHNTSTLESTTDEVLFSRVGNVDRERYGTKQPTIDGQENYFSMPLGLRVRVMDAVNFDITGDFVPGKSERNGVYFGGSVKF